MIHWLKITINNFYAKKKVIYLSKFLIFNAFFLILSINFIHFDLEK